MTAGRNKRIPAVVNRVNINKDHEVRYWCGRFGCSVARLRAAVKAMGIMANDVEEYLKTNS
jgi:hypothetical protein